MTDAIVLGLWMLGAFCLLVIGQLILRYSGPRKSSLYTKGGSPVNVDQQREERERVLRSINVHKAVSPFVRPVTRDERRRPS